MLFEGSMKYIYGPRPELYDLDADPDELHDLSAERPEKAEQMRQHLVAFLERWSTPGVSRTEAVDDEVRRRLESLGYLQSKNVGDQVVVEQLRNDGDPPQDHSGSINNLSAAKHLLYADKGVEALPYTEKLLKVGADNPLYLELHATALLQSGHLEEAWALARKLASEDALSTPLMLRLVESQFQRGDRRAALGTLERYLQLHPSAQGFSLEATFRGTLGEADEARAALEKALEANPEFTPARVDLAVWLARAGDDGAAEDEFLRAIEQSPYYPKAMYNYGTFLLNDGRYGDARAYFQRAVALSPTYLEARLGLVGAYLAEGDRAGAAEAREVLQRIAPDSPQAATASQLLSAP